MIASPGRLELPTLASAGLRAIQLRYGERANFRFMRSTGAPISNFRLKESIIPNLQSKICNLKLESGGGGI